MNKTENRYRRAFRVNFTATELQVLQHALSHYERLGPVNSLPIVIAKAMLVAMCDAHDDQA